jgi:flagellin-like hook-associated protein FlgL
VGANGVTSGHHFNMLVGANYTAQDVAAWQNANNYDYYDKSAPNMITIEFGQMDANGLLSLAPNNVQAKDLFADFNWDPVNNITDQEIAVGAADSGEATDWSTATITHKLKLLLQVIDGGDTVNDNYKIDVFGDGGEVGNTTGIKRVNEMRAYIGAMTNRLEHSVNNDNNQINNTQAAESVIRDVDFAKETSNFTKNQILSNCATAMLAQANSMTSSVLSLLR